jgi:hypothetical protein
VEEGLRLSNGEIVSLEVIIYATGFNILVSELTVANHTIVKQWLYFYP